MLSDAEIRWRLLRLFYDRRHNNRGWVPISDVDFAPDEVGGPVIEDVCRQLADLRLIVWDPLLGDAKGPVIGLAQITGQGVVVVEARHSPDVDIRFPKLSENKEAGAVSKGYSHGAIIYATPTKADLDRVLSRILHEAHHKAQAERGRLTNELAARGLANSGALIGSAVASLDDIHKEAMRRVGVLLYDFAERMQTPVLEIVSFARPHLENIGNSLLGELPPAGLQQEHERVRHQYQIIFDQRLEGVLRDFEIGLTGDRSQLVQLSIPPLQVSQERKKEDLLKINPGFGGMNVNLIEAFHRLREWWKRRK